MAFIIGLGPPRRACPVGLLRIVGASRRILLPVVINPRVLLWISSALKSLCGSIHVPASIPATFKPARHNGSTATPPAAPNPTTATSTGLRLMAISIVPPRRPAIRLGLLVHPLHVRRSRGPRAGITNDVPSLAIDIAAVMRIAERALHGIRSRRVEEPLKILRKGHQHRVSFLG